MYNQLAILFCVKTLRERGGGQYVHSSEGWEGHTFSKEEMQNEPGTPLVLAYITSHLSVKYSWGGSRCMYKILFRVIFLFVRLYGKREKNMGREGSEINDYPLMYIYKSQDICVRPCN
jgi:hypothetical protein